MHKDSERHAGSLLYTQLLGLHGLLLTHSVFDSDMHSYDVSHVKERITKLFSWVRYESITQFLSVTEVLLSCGRLFPFPVQVLPVVVPPSCAMLVLCR